jgi:hypothetical protein
MKMMKTIVAIALLAGNAAIAQTQRDTIGEQLEAQYNFLKQQGKARDLCFKSGSIKSHYAHTMNQDKYIEWDNRRYQDCLNAGMKSLAQPPRYLRP